MVELRQTGTVKRRNNDEWAVEGVEEVLRRYLDHNGWRLLTRWNKGELTKVYAHPGLPGKVFVTPSLAYAVTREAQAALGNKIGLTKGSLTIRLKRN